MERKKRREEEGGRRAYQEHSLSLLVCSLWWSQTHSAELENITILAGRADTGEEQHLYLRLIVRVCVGGRGGGEPTYLQKHKCQSTSHT